MFKAVDQDKIISENNKIKIELENDYDYLGNRLKKLNIKIDEVKEKIKSFQVALPTWGVGTGGTRFARFPGIGEPQNIFEKIEDCAVINDLVGITQNVSPHFPWDNVDDFNELRELLYVSPVQYGLRSSSI